MKGDLDPIWQTRLHILLADDDDDDRSIFKRVVEKLPFAVTLSTVQDGEELMNYLLKNDQNLPDVLFLDLNMPKKNGSECLVEIKQNKKLKNLPVIIYSTAMPNGQEDHLYNNGAHYYVRKTTLAGIQKVLQYVVSQLQEHKFVRSTREKFVLT